MRRFSTIVLFLALSTYVTSSSIVTKDVPIKDAETEHSVAEPEVSSVAQVDEVAQPNRVTETEACAKVGQFCINHKDCCSNACLGYMKRCVSAKEFVEDE